MKTEPASNQIFADPEDVNLQDSGRALLPYADTAVNYSSAGFQASWMPRVSKLKSVLVQRFVWAWERYSVWPYSAY